MVRAFTSETTSRRASAPRRCGCRRRRHRRGEEASTHAPPSAVTAIPYPAAGSLPKLAAESARNIVGQPRRSLCAQNLTETGDMRGQSDYDGRRDRQTWEGDVRWTSTRTTRDDIPVGPSGRARLHPQSPARGATASRWRRSSCGTRRAGRGDSGPAHRGAAFPGRLGRRLSRGAGGVAPGGASRARATRGRRPTACPAGCAPVRNAPRPPALFRFRPLVPTWPGILADFLAAGYNINAVNWLVASGPSRWELVVLEWFRRWLGYPEGAGGIFTSGGSSATLNALVAAREAAGNPERPVVYLSDQTHGAVARAARVVGVAPEHVRALPNRGLLGLDAEALGAAIRQDRSAGLNPIVIAANAGSASTGAVDPLAELADTAAAENLWLHVDAAYGGFAMLTENGKRLLRGIERADSVALDPHKWFFQGYEAGCLLVKDNRTLENSFAVRPDVLQDTVWGAKPPEPGGPQSADEPSIPRAEVWVSVRPSGWPPSARRSNRGSIWRRRRRTRGDEPGPRTCQPRATRDPVFRRTLPQNSTNRRSSG